MLVRPRRAGCGPRPRIRPTQTPHVRPPPWSHFERRTVTTNVVAVAEIDSRFPAEGGDLAATEDTPEQLGDDRAVDRGAALGSLRALEAAAGAARPAGRWKGTRTTDGQFFPTAGRGQPAEWSLPSTYS